MPFMGLLTLPLTMARLGEKEAKQLLKKNRK